MAMSPSSRRAWIEIICGHDWPEQDSVALLAEGVDRNQYYRPDGKNRFCRPPRGGRG